MPKTMTKDKTSEQAVIPPASEVRQAGFLYCKITDISSNSGGESEKDKSMRIGLSLRLEPIEGEIREILPDGIIDVLATSEGMDYIPFKSMSFDMPGGVSVKLSLFESISSSGFFNQSVKLNHACKLKVVDGAIHLQVSFGLPLEGIDIKLPYTLQTLFDSQIFCQLFKEQTEMELE